MCERVWYDYLCVEQEGVLYVVEVGVARQVVLLGVCEEHLGFAGERRGGHRATHLRGKGGRLWGKMGSQNAVRGVY